LGAGKKEFDRECANQTVATELHLRSAGTPLEPWPDPGHAQPVVERSGQDLALELNRRVHLLTADRIRQSVVRLAEHLMVCTVRRPWFRRRIGLKFEADSRCEILLPEARAPLELVEICVILAAGEWVFQAGTTSSTRMSRRNGNVFQSLSSAGRPSCSRRAMRKVARI
jgi:hypothetical protein